MSNVGNAEMIVPDGFELVKMSDLVYSYNNYAIITHQSRLVDTLTTLM